MWFVRIALDRPYTFVVIAILLMFFGILSIFKTPTDIFPSIDIPVVSVVWTYSGMPPDDMANRITTMFELVTTETVNNIEHMESQSLLGVSVVKIFFHEGTNIAVALSQVTSVAQTVLKLLPPGITPPYVLSFDASTVPIINLVLTSDTLPEQKLNDLANNFVRPQLASIQGATVPSGYGGKLRQIVMNLSAKAMQQYGLSAQNVSDALNRQSLIIPAGTQKIGPYEYIIKTNNNPKTIKELNEIPIKSDPNVAIYLRNLGRLIDGFPPQTNIVNYNGKRAVMLSIEKIGHSSTLTIINRIVSLLPIIKANLTKALDISISNNQALFVKSAISGVVSEAVIATLLTGAMILLFLGSLRSTFIVTLSIPLAILASLLMLSALGGTINIMTLGGLALSVGILVDNGTVTIENIFWQLSQGKGLKDAILSGAMQISIPAFVSTLCICIVFLPLFLLKGVSEFLFIPLAEAVIFAMVASYLISRTLVPTMVYYMLDEKSAHGEGKGILGRIHHGFNKKFTQLQNRYEQQLMKVLDHAPTFCIAFLSFVLLSLAVLWPALGSNFFPKVDAGRILLHYSAPPGTRIEETAKLASDVNELIREVIPAEQLESTVDNIGLPTSGINLSYNNSGTNGANDTDTLITLKPKHDSVEHYTSRLREKLNKAFPAVQVSFLPADIVNQILNFGTPSVIDIQITGLKAKKNRHYAELLLSRIKHIPGIVDARIRQSNQYPALTVENDRTLAKEMGLTQYDVGTNLLIALAGSFQTRPNFWLDPDNNMPYPITAQIPQYNMDSLHELLSTPITKAIPNKKTPQVMGAMTKIKRSNTSLVVSHYNIQPMINIFANIEGRDLGAVSGDIDRVVTELKTELPEGSQQFIRGQIATQKETFTTLYSGLVISILLIYMIIVINFQSWLYPFIIISALPAALAGIAWMLFLTHTTLSVPALTGCIVCMGVATANSILVVSFARSYLLEGYSIKKAVLMSGVSRLRPVLMTNFAMIIGMLPMALALGDGGEQNAPLGRTVIGGLSLATIATLFFVPAVFCIMRHRKPSQGEQYA